MHSSVQFSLTLLHRNDSTRRYAINQINVNKHRITTRGATSPLDFIRRFNDVLVPAA
jgi:hypothetical protein